VGGLDSGSGLLGTAGDWALREFSWATSGPISRFESEPFGDLFSLRRCGPKRTERSLGPR
jgi:hypothetical protein